MIFWAAITALVFLVLYVASYLYFAKPATFCRKEIWPVYVWRENPLWSQEFWTSLYGPVHWIDFRIRKRLWQPASPKEFRGRFYYRPGLTTREDWGEEVTAEGNMANAENDECQNSNV